jgi:hypothetical protein
MIIKEFQTTSNIKAKKGTTINKKEIIKLKRSYEKYFIEYGKLLVLHDNGDISNEEFNDKLIDISKKQSNKVFHKTTATES